MRFPEANPQRAQFYRQSGQWRDVSIPHLFSLAVAALPEKVAVRDASGASLTYAALDAQVNRVAGYLAGHGVGRRDIVTVCLPNWWQAVVVFLAVMKAGGVVNPVQPTYGRAELSYVIGKCRSAALFIAGRFRSTDFTSLAASLDQRPSNELVIRVGEGQEDIGVPFDTVAAREPLPQLPGVIADDPVAVLFTSGTESRPKGAVHTHNTILFGERALAQALAIGRDDIAFMPSPITHTTGFMHGVVMTLTTGGTLSLLDVFDGATAAAQMRAHRCTWTMGATPFLGDVAMALAKSGARLPDLRYFLCGGAPVPENLVRRAGEAGLRVMSVYGSTESPPHTVVHPDDPPESAWLSDGRPLAGIETRIVGTGGVPQPTGEVGEEWSRGPNTFLGYLDDPELTRKDLDQDGWYHSGDLARALPDGSLRIAGRLKDIIVRGGQNISTREIEDHLAAHPAIQAVAVVAILHPRLGETGCAVVVTKPGCSVTLLELTAFLAEKGIARFKLPERLEVWPSLPMTLTGKVQKFLIRKALNEKPGLQQP